MEDYVSPVLAFLGGVVLAIVNAFLNRRRSGIEVGGLRDDQTAKWRDNALHLSDEILEMDKEMRLALRETDNQSRSAALLRIQLAACLERTGRCKCSNTET